MQALDRKSIFNAASCLLKCARNPLQQPRIAPPRIVLQRFSERRALHSSRSRRASGRNVPLGSDAITNEHVSPLELPGPAFAHQYPSKTPLPVTCPGCGALSQETEPASPGHYTRTRKTVKLYLQRLQKGDAADEIQHAEVTQGITNEELKPEAVSTSVPFCDRCHELTHESRGVSIAHPSIEDIADSIAESPHKRNHVYHVLDAADFPMSLIPSILSSLTLAKPRSQNRRSQQQYTVRPSFSFIITRSDLLAPTKEKVDSLMPYIREVLRDALGTAGGNMRLGNVHLVSAKRGWWTSAIKEEIWNRGGGSFMVGKFNVGKSALFEVLFPKGSGERAPVYANLVKQQAAVIQEHLPETQLLPPPQPEVPFPTLPLVSSLPGTTASPIRLSFGNRKGELIDMPGLERGNLDHYVRPEHKLDLVMTSRASAKQHTLKPGQSLLLGGGVVRITPVQDGIGGNLVMMAYPFVPLDAHVTSTEKARGTQQLERESGIDTILADDAGPHFKSAGIFDLTTDVTKHHAGPMLRAGMSVSDLPFRVYSTDLLIQGVGWVELVCQIRRTKQEGLFPNHHPEDDASPKQSASDLSVVPSAFKPYTPQLEPGFLFPQVEVFTPNGEHISSRRSMGAWTIWKEGKLQRNRNLPARPRRPMSGDKAQKKRQGRTQSST